MGKKTTAIPRRPLPPIHLGVYNGADTVDFLPAPEVLAWIKDEILSEDGRLHNPDHKHLEQANLQVLWAAAGYVSKQRRVVGTAEEVAFRCSAWQKGRQEQQMREWFGDVPDYLITLDAQYARECSDTEWCALVEHECYHIAHKLDEWGAPAFTQDGRPKLGIRGHDVEEFVGVVRRYGVGDPDSSLAKLVAAAKAAPEVSGHRIAGACGTCMLRVA